MILQQRQLTSLYNRSAVRSRLIIMAKRNVSPFSSNTTNNTAKPSLLENVKFQFQIFKSGIARLRSETEEKLQIQQRIQKQKTLMTRREFLLCHRNDQDISKLAPFMIISILIPEIIPIIVLKFPQMIPSTFFSTEQISTKRKALNDTRREIALAVMNEAIHSHHLDLRDIGESGLLSVAFVKRVLKEADPSIYNLDSLEWARLQQVAVFFGISKWNIPSWIRQDLQKHFEFLRKDETEYLGQSIDDHGAILNSLSMEEVEEACEARGISTVGRDRGELHQRMILFSHLLNTLSPPNAFPGKISPADQLIYALLIVDGVEREKMIGTIESPLNRQQDSQ